MHIIASGQFNKSNSDRKQQLTSCETDLVLEPELIHN